MNIIDLSKFGQNHSRLLDELRKLITDELREHPVTSCFVILPPNFTKFGDPMEAGPTRETSIQKARDEAFRALTEIQTNALVKECTWLWDKASLGENSVRELTVKFAIIVSNQVHTNNNKKSMFFRSSLWRWGAFPSLLTAMHRSAYRNWTSEVETFGQESNCVQVFSIFRYLIDYPFPSPCAQHGDNGIVEVTLAPHNRTPLRTAW